MWLTEHSTNGGNKIMDRTWNSVYSWSVCLDEDVAVFLCFHHFIKRTFTIDSNSNDIAINFLLILEWVVDKAKNHQKIQVEN